MKLLALLLLVSTARADEWSRTDTALEITYAAAHVMDWMQTRDIAIRPTQFSETNPILGSKPSVAEVNRYFAASLAMHAAVSFMLPTRYRRVWQQAGITMEAACLARNVSIGVSMRLP